MVICYSTKNIKKPFEIAGSNLKGVILLIILWISPLLLKGQNCQKLFQSVAENDTESVRILLLKNTNINCKNEIGQSPLALAVIKDNVDMVQLLLDQKANINLPVTTTLETPLILAAKAHNQQLVRLLLENGADPNIADSAGRTPLIWCCIRNDYELIKYLLGNGADLHKTTNYGNTALELAIWYQNTISAKILMIRGANLNSQGSKDKGTPLLYACIKEEYALAIELIRRGANVHAVNKNGDGILHILAKDSQSLEKTEFKYSSFSYIYPTIQDTLYTEGIHSFYEYLQSLNVDLFLRNNEGFMPLHIAAINNNKALIYALTKDKSNLNNRENKLGATPLVCALRNNHPRSAKILLYEKPDVQIMDTNGWTPLHYASRDNYQEIVLTLLEMDAQVNVVNRNNWTPMHLAAYNGNDCIVRLLLHFGADKSLKNSLGETAEMLAANKNLDETIQILKLNKVGLVDLYLCGMSNYVQKQVANGLNLNEVDSKGRNLLHAALLNGNSGFAENLIQSGIDFKIKDSSGTSPFLLAARENLQEICLLLLDKGAAVNDYDTSGMSALHYAVKNDDTLLVRLLLIKGANVNKRHRTEGTPLEVACWYHGNTSSIECLTSYGAEINPEHFTTWSPLSLAIKKEFREAALWLVKHGANVNFKMGNGVTILHMIVGQQMGSLFMECINRGADINAQTTDSLITSLHLAAECNNLNMVKILFWNGADTNLRMLGNLRPVDIAIGKGNLEIARFLQSPVYDYFELLNYGQDSVILRKLRQSKLPINIKNNRGTPFLHEVIREDNWNILKLLVSHNADLNIRDTLGRSPLIFAIFLGNEELAKYLIKIGVDINAISKYGETAFSIAERREYSNLKRILLKLGASPLYKIIPRPELLIPSVQESFDIVSRYSPDGKFMITGCNTNQLIVWDAKTGQIIRKLHGDFHNVADIAFSADSKMAVTIEGARTDFLWGSRGNATQNTRINLWDLQTGEQIRVIDNGKDFQRSTVCISKDGNMIVTGGARGFIEVFEVHTGRLVNSFSIIGSGGLNPRIRKVALIDGNRILSAGYENDLYMWDLWTGKLIRRFTGHKAGNEAMAVSPDGRWAVSVDQSGEIILWNIASGKKVKSLKDPVKSVNDIIFSPDNKLIAIAHGFLAGDEVLSVIELKTGRTLCNFHENQAFVSVQFSNSGKSILASCIAEAGKGIIAKELKIPDLPFEVMQVKDFHGSIKDFVMTEDNRFLIMGAEYGDVFVKDLKKGNASKKVLELKQGISFISTSPYLKGQAIIGTDRGSLFVFDLIKFKINRQMSVLDAEIKAVVFHKDGRRVTSMDENGTLCTWHIQTGIILDSASAPGYENYRCMAMNPEETEILIAGEYLMHYDLMSGKWQRNPYKIQDKEITSVTWFNEGKKIEIISLTARYEIDGLNKHIKIIYPFNDMLGRQWKEEFSNNARYRLSAERYRGYFYLALYDQKNGSCVQKISSCDDDFLRVKFSSDQKFILSLGVRNGELRRVPIEPNQFVREFRVENLVSEVKGLSPDGDFVYLSNDSVLQRWGLSEMKRRSVNIGSKQRITHLQCMKGPEDLLFCNDSGRIYLCNFNSATIFRSILVSPKSEHKTIAISRNQKFLVSAGFDGRIYLYDIKAGILFKTFSDSLRPSSFAIAPSGKMLFMGGSNQETIIPTGSTRSVTTGNIYLSELNLETGRRNRIIDYGKGSFKFIKVAPDNLSMVAGDVSNFHYNVKQYYFPDFQVVSTMQGLFREAMNAEFTHNSRYLSLCFNDGKITIFYLDNMRQNELHGHSNSVLETVFSPDDRFLFSRGSDHMVKAWDVSSGNELFSFLMLKDTGWFYLTPDRYYFASKIALKEMAWTIGMKKYDFEQFDLIYNRPDLVLAKIPYADTSLIPFYRKAYEKRLKKAGFNEPMLESGFHVPEIQITNIEDIPAKTDQVELKVRIKATDNRELLRKLQVWVNEIPVFGQKGLELSKYKSKSLNKNLNLKLSQGTNKIAISVLNAKGAESTKETFTIEYQPIEISKPNLYVISISVSKYSDSAFNLQYAVKDGRDIVNLFKNKQERFGKVIVDSLFDMQVNLERIKSLKQKLMNTTVDDEVVIFISGHGLLDNQLNFYFASHQMDFNNPAENGIPYEALEDLLDGIPARNKLMLMDACHSGETDIDEQLVGATDTLQINNEQTVKLRTYGHKGAVLPNNLKTGHVGLQNSFELMKVLFSEMDHGNGTVIISAAAGMGYAYESPEWNNGVFTYCVLNGMKNMAADINNDLEISVSELKTYVSREVENLTFGKQKPTSRRENISIDFRIW